MMVLLVLWSFLVLFKIYAKSSKLFRKTNQNISEIYSGPKAQKYRYLQNYLYTRNSIGGFTKHSIFGPLVFFSPQVFFNFYFTKIHES